MNTSKKLSIVQLILNILIFIVAMILIYAAVQLYKSHTDNSYYHQTNYEYADSYYASKRDFYLLFTIASAAFILILNIGNLVIGIMQIVFRSKESTSGVYLASGIIGILMFFFITLAIPLAITMIILNSIGICKKNL